MNPMIPGWESIADFAGRLGFRRETVWGWITSGVSIAGRRVKLAAVRIGGRWMIHGEAFEVFQAGCNPTAGPSPISPAADQRRREAEAAALAAELAGGVR